MYAYITFISNELLLDNNNYQLKFIKISACDCYCVSILKCDVMNTSALMQTKCSALRFQSSWNWFPLIHTRTYCILYTQYTRSSNGKKSSSFCISFDIFNYYFRSAKLHLICLFLLFVCNASLVAAKEIIFSFLSDISVNI